MANSKAATPMAIASTIALQVAADPPLPAAPAAR